MTPTSVGYKIVKIVVCIERKRIQKDEAKTRSGGRYMTMERRNEKKKN